MKTYLREASTWILKQRRKENKHADDKISFGNQFFLMAGTTTLPLNGFKLVLNSVLDD